MVVVVVVVAVVVVIVVVVMLFELFVCVLVGTLLVGQIPCCGAWSASSVTGFSVCVCYRCELSYGLFGGSF